MVLFWELTLSTIEFEYMAATHASKEAVWLQILCSGIGLVQQAVRIDFDSQSAISLTKNSTHHSKTKHIDVQYHFVRDIGVFDEGGDFEECCIFFDKVCEH